MSKLAVRALLVLSCAAELIVAGRRRRARSAVNFGPIMNYDPGAP